INPQGFAWDWPKDSAQASRKARSANYDAIILDQALPDTDALSLLERWRSDGVEAPVLLLSDGLTEKQLVHGFNSGADQCVVKPVDSEELLARVRALLRRGHQISSSVLRIHDLEIDLAGHTVKRAGQTIYLTPKEWGLLRFLAYHRGKLVTRSMIKEHLYDEHGQRTSNVVDVYIRYLRNKIDKDFETPLIITQWGRGYMLRNGDQ